MSCAMFSCPRPAVVITTSNEFGVLTKPVRSTSHRSSAKVTIRLVKGANMEMERVEASQRGWPQATFTRR